MAKVPSGSSLLTLRNVKRRDQGPAELQIQIISYSNSDPCYSTKVYLAMSVFVFSGLFSFYLSSFCNLVVLLAFHIFLQFLRFYVYYSVYVFYFSSSLIPYDNKLEKKGIKYLVTNMFEHKSIFCCIYY